MDSWRRHGWACSLECRRSCTLAPWTHRPPPFKHLQTISSHVTRTARAPYTAASPIFCQSWAASVSWLQQLIQVADTWRVAGSWLAHEGYEATKRKPMIAHVAACESTGAPNASLGTANSVLGHDQDKVSPRQTTVELTNMLVDNGIRILEYTRVLYILCWIYSNNYKYMYIYIILAYMYLYRSYIMIMSLSIVMDVWSCALMMRDFRRCNSMKSRVRVWLLMSRYRAYRPMQGLAPAAWQKYRMKLFWVLLTCANLIAGWSSDSWWCVNLFLANQELLGVFEVLVPADPLLLPNGLSQPHSCAMTRAPGLSLQKALDAQVSRHEAGNMYMFWIRVLLDPSRTYINTSTSWSTCQHRQLEHSLVKQLM